MRNQENKKLLEDIFLYIDIMDIDESDPFGYMKEINENKSYYIIVPQSYQTWKGVYEYQEINEVGYIDIYDSFQDLLHERNYIDFEINNTTILAKHYDGCDVYDIYFNDCDSIYLTFNESNFSKLYELITNDEHEYTYSYVYDNEVYDMIQENKSIEEIKKYVLENNTKIEIEFYNEQDKTTLNIALEYLKENDNHE